MRINDFISDKKTHVIPVYQRNYDWKVENCAQLFNDLTYIAKNDNDHFIGTFVYQHKPAAGIFQEFIIIDGQQRITSIILFAKAIYDLTDDEDLKEEIYSTFIKHSRGELKGKCKLRPTEYDRATFEKLMVDDAFDENNFTAVEKNSALYRNYKFFRDKVYDSPLEMSKLYYAIYNLKVVSILLQNENAQEIFESLNSTGLALGKADLIRNFLLMPLDYDVQENFYKTYWLKIEELLRASDNVENFLEQYLVAKFKSRDAYSTKISPSTLYVVFKKFFNDKYIDTESCLKDLLRYAKFFRRVIFNDETKFDNLSALDKKFYELTFLLKADNSPIVLMYLLDRFDKKKDFDEATFIKFVDALISLVFRAKICSRSGITSQFAGNVLARLDKENFLDEKNFWQAITFGKGRYSFPGDKEFQTALVSENLYTTIKSPGCKYLLYSLERAARAKELPAYSEATVEHIMPQKLNDKWKEYLSTRNDLPAHEQWLHTLGNLTLTAYNSELSNANFDTKKKIYAQSNYHYTRALTNHNDWTSKQIQSRAQRLAAEAIKIWTLPDKFNATLPGAGDIVTLDSDFATLKNKKPASLFIFGEEIKMPHWNWALREVVRQLYALDADTFRRATQLENVRRSLFTTEETDFKIDDGFFMETGFDTEFCLKTIKVLAENFDKLGDTNIKDEIYFTLKR